MSTVLRTTDEIHAAVLGELQVRIPIIEIHLCGSFPILHLGECMSVRWKLCWPKVRMEQLVTVHVIPN